MKEILLFLVLLSTVVLALEHVCIHDEMEKRIQVSYIPQKYEEGAFLKAQRQLEAEREGREPEDREPVTGAIRIVIDYKYLDAVGGVNSDIGRSCYTASDSVAVGNAIEGSPDCSDVIFNDCWYSCTENDIMTESKLAYLKDYVIINSVDILHNALAVVPVQGDLDVGSKTCTNYFVTSRPGVVPAADIVLYVTARPSRPGVLAYAVSCAVDSFTKRPVLALVNFAPSKVLADADPVQSSSYVAVSVHEIVHALGFTSTNWGASTNFFNATTNTTQDVANIIAEGQVGDGLDGTQHTQKFLITPSVVSYVRTYFGCSTLLGGELEDQGGSGTAMSHWEKRVYNNEFMTGTSSLQAVISPLTFMLLQDSGWYYINSSFVFGKLTWGKDRGCGFATGTCINKTLSEPPAAWEDHACPTPSSQNVEYCTNDFLARGYCSLKAYAAPLDTKYQHFTADTWGGASDLPDFCPLIQPFGNGDCRVAPASDIPFKQNGQVHHETSRCHKQNLIHKLFVPTDDKSAGCYPRICVSASVYRVKVKDFFFDCDTAGKVISHPEFNGALTCQDPQKLCSPTYYDGAYDAAWPVYSDIAPFEGRINGGYDVTITGTGFVAGTTVTIAGVACDISEVTATSITCETGDMSKGVYKENEKGLVVITVPNGKTCGGAHFILMPRDLLDAAADFLIAIYDFIYPIAEKYWYGGVTPIVLGIVLSTWCCIRVQKRSKKQREVEKAAVVAMQEVERRKRPKKAWDDA